MSGHRAKEPQPKAAGDRRRSFTTGGQKGSWGKEGYPLPRNFQAWPTAITISVRCFLTISHEELPRTMSATLRDESSADMRKFLSFVRSKSKPACSAAVNRSPFVRRSQPHLCAVETVCPSRYRARPYGAPWSSRIRIKRTYLNFGYERRRRCTSSSKLEHRLDLLQGHRVVLDDFLNTRAIFEVFEDDRNRHAAVSQHPGTADSPWHAFDGWTL